MSIANISRDGSRCGLVLWKPSAPFTLQPDSPCLLARHLGKPPLRVDQLEQDPLVNPAAVLILPFLPRPSTLPKAIFAGG